LPGNCFIKTNVAFGERTETPSIATNNEWMCHCTWQFDEKQSRVRTVLKRPVNRPSGKAGKEINPLPGGPNEGVASQCSRK
jgi:hypothetical protein